MACVPPSPLADLALLSLVIAHTADTDLGLRESRAVVHQLQLLSDSLGDGGVELSDLVEGAVATYGEMSVVGLDAVVARLATTLDPPQREMAISALIEVADADGTVHLMEQTVIRHIAQAWGLA